MSPIGVLPSPPAGIPAAAIGVDAGSTTWKAVAIGPGGEILASEIESVNPRIEEQTRKGIEALRAKAGAGAGVPIGATGYGRKLIAAAQKNLTEISCHARGCFHRVRTPGVLVDIGGQDTKVIRIGPDGGVRDFVMNEKCAAGTGRFLEVVLNRLGVPLDQVEAYAVRARGSASITSTCTVFAETEVISLVAEGVPLEEIVLGLHRSLAKRIGALAARMADSERVYVSGGVARNAVLVRALGEALHKAVVVVPDPQLIGALGAALSVLP